MKKVLCLFLAVTCMLTIVACGNSSNVTPTENTNNAENTTPITPTEPVEEKDVALLFANEKYRTFVPESYKQTKGDNIVIASKDNGFLMVAYHPDVESYDGMNIDLLLTFADGFNEAVTPYLPSAMIVEELKEVELKTSIASGYSGIKFWGDVNTESKDTYKVYGWMVLVDKKPLLVAGVQYEDITNEDIYDTLTDYVGFMSATIQIVK